LISSTCKEKVRVRERERERERERISNIYIIKKGIEELNSIYILLHGRDDEIDETMGERERSRGHFWNPRPSW
jgi:hypothetical protein